MNKAVSTQDGSSSIYVEELNEHYHSIHGAVQESEHIFIKSGFSSDNFSSLNTVSILEIGFGTGLNALLTYFYAIETQKHVNYTAIEPYPIHSKELQLLNYGDKLPYPQAKDTFYLLHNAEWERFESIADHFSICKHKISALDMSFVENTYDLVYFDAFSPAVQPELWTSILFDKIYRAMKNNGIFVTYSTKGDVKRALKQVGFSIEKLKGPPGKREILRARK